MATSSSFRSWQLLLCAGLLASSAGGATAQTAPDTTRRRVGEVLPPPLAAPRQPRSLWKLGLNNFLPTTTAFGPDSYYSRYGLHLAVEHKLRNPAWSVLAEVSPALTHYRPTLGPSSGPRLSGRAQVAWRYYYNRERRQRQGHSGVDFWANYVAVALGSGLGPDAHETPFFFYQNDRRRALVADMALLYGWQRRLGRYGFADAAIGVATLLVAGKPVVGLGSSLRVGFVVGAQPPRYSHELAPRNEAWARAPRLYAGAALGGYFYHVRYSAQNPYPAPVVKTTPTETQTTAYPTTYRDGYGHYAQYVAAGPVPYVYVGYYLAPRIAVQLGLQYGQTFNAEPVGTVFTSAAGTFAVPNHTLAEHGLALPVLGRYALAVAFRHRVQLAAVGGLVPVWSSVWFREFAIVNHALTSQEAFGFRRRAFGLHATLGFDASYTFGRRRRLQATTEFLLNKDVQTSWLAGRRNPGSGAYLAGGGSMGLAYRFGYR